MLEEVSLFHIFGIVVYVVGSIASLVISHRWLRADIDAIKESDIKVALNFNNKITRLYTRTDDMMTKKEIAELLTLSTGPIKEDTQELKATMILMSESINQMTINFARMDERMKLAQNGDRTRRITDQ